MVEKDTKGEKVISSFSDIVGRNMVELDMTMDQLLKFRNLIKRNSNNTKLLPPAKTVEKLLEKTVVYKIFNLKKKRE